LYIFKVPFSSPYFLRLPSHSKCKAKQINARTVGHSNFILGRDTHTHTAKRQAQNIRN
jgi:hypothetical protein